MANVNLSDSETAELIDIVYDKLAELDDLSQAFGQDAPEVHSRIAILEAIIVKLTVQKE